MNHADLIEISCGAASARISPMGAELRAWMVGGEDFLWAPDPAVWDATSPVLFPVCGWTRNGQMRIGGRTYPLGLHGFARAEPFDIEARGGDFVRFVLRDNARTRAQYPFAFELRLEYRLNRSRLDVEASVKNVDGEAMPYAFGLHPGFRWPRVGECKSACVIRFDRPERRQVPVIAPGGLFSDRHRPVAFADARTLALSDELFAQEALCFLHAASDGLDLLGPQGRILRVETSAMPHIVLWSRPGAPFLCIETWTGHGDPEGFDGQLSQKPSMISLAPGAVSHHAATFIAG